MSSDSLPEIKSLSGEGNFFENLFTDIANAGLQTFTGGLVGIKDGKIGAGVTTKGLKDVTGATAAEQANAQAQAQFEQARKDAEAARIEQQNKIAQDQVTQSKLAGSARTNQQTRTNRGSGATGSFSVGQDERDFLGL